MHPCNHLLYIIFSRLDSYSIWVWVELVHNMDDVTLLSQLIWRPLCNQLAPRRSATGVAIPFAAIVCTVNENANSGKAFSPQAPAANVGWVLPGILPSPAASKEILCVCCIASCQKAANTQNESLGNQNKFNATS